jgi:hypothetical protein
MGLGPVVDTRARDFVRVFARAEEIAERRRAHSVDHAGLEAEVNLEPRTMARPYVHAFLELKNSFRTISQQLRMCKKRLIRRGLTTVVR